MRCEPTLPFLLVCGSSLSCIGRCLAPAAVVAGEPAQLELLTGGSAFRPVLFRWCEAMGGLTASMRVSESAFPRFQSHLGGAERISCRRCERRPCVHAARASSELSVNAELATQTIVGCALSEALFLQPKLLMLDEPTNHLDRTGTHPFRRAQLVER